MYELAKILVVDDEGDIRALTRRTLSSVGHEVDVANDGNEALESMSENDYDLIVLDVMMPNKNGIEVIRDMRKTDQLRDIPVLIFSALGSGTRLMKEEGPIADDYIEKPFTRKEIITKIEKMLNKTE